MLHRHMFFPCRCIHLFHVSLLPVHLLLIQVVSEPKRFNNSCNKSWRPFCPRPWSCMRLSRSPDTSSVDPPPLRPSNSGSPEKFDEKTCYTCRFQCQNAFTYHNYIYTHTFTVIIYIHMLHMHTYIYIYVYVHNIYIHIYTYLSWGFVRAQWTCGTRWTRNQIFVAHAQRRIIYVNQNPWVMGCFHGHMTCQIKSNNSHRQTH
jgi:hypothetical protein